MTAMHEDFRYVYWNESLRSIKSPAIDTLADDKKRFDGGEKLNRDQS